MMRGSLLAVVCAGLLSASVVVDAQRRRTPTRRPAPEPVKLVTESAKLTCPQLLGDGVRTARSYCDVTIGRDPAAGVIVDIPPHRGTVTLSFDLHNRHLYSEEEIKANRGYRRYTSTIGVLAMDNTLLSRAVVQNEFRAAADLVDRISGGLGPGGVKAVAPTGLEPIIIEVEEEANQVSLLGERLMVITVDGTDTFTAPGRPIAVVSNVMLTYTPAPPPPAPATRKPSTTRR